MNYKSLFGKLFIQQQPHLPKDTPIAHLLTTDIIWGSHFFKVSFQTFPHPNHEIFARVASQALSSRSPPSICVRIYIHCICGHSSSNWAKKLNLIG